MRHPLDIERKLPETCHWCDEKPVRWLRLGNGKDAEHYGVCKEHLGSCRYVTFVAGNAGNTHHVFA
jgi:hypothetical protein